MQGLDKKEAEIPEFNQQCYEGVVALEKIMAEMTKKGTDIERLMTFISVVWAAHAINIMKNYVPDILHPRFRDDILTIAEATLGSMLETVKQLPKKELQ